MAPETLDILFEKSSKIYVYSYILMVLVIISA